MVPMTAQDLCSSDTLKMYCHNYIFQPPRHAVFKASNDETSKFTPSMAIALV